MLVKCLESQDGGKASLSTASLFVMCPHPNDLYNPPVFEDLVHKTMLNIDATRIRSAQITDKLLISRGRLEGINFEDFEQLLGFWFQTRRGEFLGVFLCLFGENKPPFHQESSGEHFSTGVFKPRTIDSRILGMESKYNVSWIALQSSAEIRTPSFLFPTMWIGSWDFSDSARSFEILAFVAVTVLIKFNILHYPKRVNEALPPSQK